MSLFNFFFPQQATASHLQDLVKSKRRQGRRDSRRQRELDKEIEALEDDIGYIAMVLGALLQKVDEKGILSRDEVRQTLRAIDELDGVKDGRLDVNILRSMGS